MKYSKFYFKNVRISLDTLNTKFRGASLMRNLRKVASHITGMTIRSMRSVLNFFSLANVVRKGDSDVGDNVMLMIS